MPVVVLLQVHDHRYKKGTRTHHHAEDTSHHVPRLYPYPIDHFAMVDHPLPPRLGGGWDDATTYPESELQAQEIEEYYGQVNDFVGKITDEDNPINITIVDKDSNVLFSHIFLKSQININLDEIIHTRAIKY